MARTTSRAASARWWRRSGRRCGGWASAVRLNTPACYERRGTAAATAWGPPGAAEPFDSVVVNADPLASLQRGDEPLALSGYVLLLEVDGRPSVPHHTVLFGHDYRREFDELFSGRLAERSDGVPLQPLGDGRHGGAARGARGCSPW